MQKSFIKALFVTLALTVHGLTSYGQLSQQLIVLKTDTVLYLTKPQSVSLANYVLTHDQLRYRFSAALVRESAVRDLWQETSRQLALRESESEVLSSQLEFCEDHLEKTVEVTKKDRRVAVMRAGVVFLAVGFVVGVLVN